MKSLFIFLIIIFMLVLLPLWGGLACSLLGYLGGYLFIVIVFVGLFLLWPA